MAHAHARGSVGWKAPTLLAIVIAVGPGRAAAFGARPTVSRNSRPVRTAPESSRRARRWLLRDEARTLGRAAQIAEREASRLRADADAADRGVAEAEAALAKLL